MTQNTGRPFLARIIGTVAPRMAGASLPERFIAALVAALAIGITAFICGIATGFDPGLPLIVAPLGASAVLLFAVPSSPLAQPWAIIAGNTLSAFAAIAVIHLVPQPVLAAGTAVGVAIAVMALTRSLHPPGGAVALLVALIGPEGAAGSFGFALVPVGLNSVVLVLLGFGFHRFSGHPYPHLPKPAASPHGTSDPPPQERQGVIPSDVEAAVAESGEVFDIGKDDLARLLRRAGRAAAMRLREVPRCGDVMSKDVLTVSPEATLDEARDLLLARNLRTLPVVTAAGEVTGVVGLRNLIGDAARVGDVMRPASIALNDQGVLDLVDPLTDGRTHAVVIVDADRQLAGLITQTDLIAVLADMAVADAIGDVPRAGA